jgi:hypothetical protein
MHRSIVVTALLIAIGACNQTPPKRESTSPAVACVFEARQANDYWGSNIHTFANPPYDAQAWDTFKSNVEQRLSSAESKCRCSDPACTRAIEGMNELRTMVSEIDAAVRSDAGAPTDLVQRQERVDQALDAARDAAK